MFCDRVRARCGHTYTQVVDFYSYFYHFVGHKVPAAWSIHRFHHKFYNPTPFGVRPFPPPRATHTCAQGNR